MRLMVITRRNLGRTALLSGLLMLLILVFVSNRFVYLSHQRFPALAPLQWTQKAPSELRIKEPLVIGHRGSGLPSTDSNATPDNRTIGNTRNAIAAAIEADADWIEIDIRMSGDRELVVFHDPRIDAKCTGKGAVAELNLKDLKACDVLVSPSEKILSLQEVFDAFGADQRHWILDIKSAGISHALVTRIEASRIPKEQIIIFGDHDILTEYKGSGFRLGYTTLYSTHQNMILSAREVIKRCQDQSFDLLVVPIFFITPGLVTEARKHGLEVWSYDSNDPRDLQYCLDCGVQGLIVDFPKTVMALFRD